MDYSFLLKILATIIFGIILGALSSIPVGAVQLEVIKKTINGNIKSAIAIACGSAASDFLYGVLTLYGVGDFLFHKKFQVIVYSLGIIVLSFLLYKTIKERNYMLHKELKIKPKMKLSFLTGFTIAITNPGMIIWWVIGYKLFIDLHLFPSMDGLTGHSIKALFIFSGCLGLGGYLMGVASILHHVKKTLSDRFLYKTNIFLMGLLSILILYFGVKLFSLIFNFQGLPGALSAKPATVSAIVTALSGLV